MLAVLGLLAAGTGAALAQPAQFDPCLPMPAQYPPATVQAPPTPYARTGLAQFDPSLPMPAQYSPATVQAPPAPYAGTGAAVAQPAAGHPSFPVPGQAAPAPVPPPTVAPPPPGARPGWDRNFDSIILSAAGPQAPAAPLAPAEPESPANRVWFAADYLMWWTKDGPLPTPLLTTGSPSAAIVGGLTQPGTQVLFGGSDQDYGTTSGLRVVMGGWLDGDRHWGLEAGVFVLEQRATQFGTTADAAGSPVLAQPLIDPATGQEFTEVLALPGLVTGSVAITTRSRLLGWELNGLANAFRTDSLSFDLLGGFRAVQLDEDLQMVSSFSPLVDQFLTFPGHAVSTGSTVATFDKFQAQNQFYGVQLGGRAEWCYHDLAVSASGKLALGSNQEVVGIGGASALFTPGTPAVTVPGGVLAVASNSGRYSHDGFSIVPELGLQVSYRIMRHCELRFGYTLLDWSNVVRPGNQVNRAISPSQVPTDPAFGTAAGTPAAFQSHTSDYWAQGLNFGLAFWF